MCPRHCTVTPAVVRATAADLLQRALPWRPFGRLVGVAQLLDLLLLAAALGSSLSRVARRFGLGFSHETARRAVAANLPAPGQLADGLLAALYCFGSRVLRRRHWVVAIDTHLGPFYGDVAAPGVVGGKKKRGTEYFYGYATAALVHRRHRYTVGLIALTGQEKPHDVVGALLEQARSRGLRLRGVVLDAGFGSGEVLLLLPARRLSYCVPLQRCGKGSNNRNRCWELPAGAVSTLSWRTERSGRPVSTAVVVVQPPRRKARAGRARAAGGKRVYAFRGWGAGAARSARRRARLARRWYRRRFGIETSYRQMRQCKARTTKKDAAYRLLLVGVGLLLRQVWVWLTWQVARARGLRPTGWVGELALPQLCEWLADSLKEQHKEEKGIRLGMPILPYEPNRL